MVVLLQMAYTGCFHEQCFLCDSNIQSIIEECDNLPAFVNHSTSFIFKIPALYTMIFRWEIFEYNKSICMQEFFLQILRVKLPNQ